MAAKINPGIITKIKVRIICNMVFLKETVFLFDFRIFNHMVELILKESNIA